MRIDQLALRLEDESERMRLWMALPQGSRMKIARVYARLCIRAAKVGTAIIEQKGRGDACKLKR